jgi:hypothetical protein
MTVVTDPAASADAPMDAGIPSPSESVDGFPQGISSGPLNSGGDVDCPADVEDRPGESDEVTMSGLSDTSGDGSGDADSDTTAETHQDKERSHLSPVALELRCLAQLRASKAHYDRLLSIAEHAKEVIARIEPDKTVVVYGSLALGRDERYYLTRTSDADLAIEAVSSPTPIVQALTSEGWEVMNSCMLARFGTHQFTLRHPQGELLDLTFVSTKEHFALFEARQKAFRKSFESARDRLTLHFKERGGQIFDAYVHLLKCFASFGGMSSFQGVCTGLFLLHYELHRWESIPGGLQQPKPENLRALPLFERFLHFIATFFTGSCSAMCSEAWQALRSKTQHQEYPPLELISGMGGCSQWVLDLDSNRWVPRKSRYWFAEMYFMDVEESFKVPPNERMNVAHSVVPSVVQGNANWLMKKLVSAAPMHWTNWTQVGERQRWQEIVKLLGCPDLEDQIA